MKFSNTKHDNYYSTDLLTYPSAQIVRNVTFYGGCYVATWSGARFCSAVKSLILIKAIRTQTLTSTTPHGCSLTKWRSRTLPKILHAGVRVAHTLVSTHTTRGFVSAFVCVLLCHFYFQPVMTTSNSSSKWAQTPTYVSSSCNTVASTIPNSHARRHAPRSGRSPPANTTVAINTAPTAARRTRSFATSTRRYSTRLTTVAIAALCNATHITSCA